MTRIADLRERLGDRANEAHDTYGPETLDVAAPDWRDAVAAAGEAGLVRLEFLTAADLLDDGFAIYAHLTTADAPVEQVLIRTSVPRSAPSLASVTDFHAGAAWHERETAEMFGIEFVGLADARRLLLADSSAAEPLRKEHYLVARSDRAWPGAKEPGESDADVATASPDAAPVKRRRRRQVPPGVPAPGDWGVS